MIWKAAFLGIGLSVCAGWAQRSMENLDRGLVAVKTSGGVFLSWQVLGTDAAGGSNPAVLILMRPMMSRLAIWTAMASSSWC